MIFNRCVENREACVQKERGRCGERERDANVHTRSLIPLIANCCMGGRNSKRAVISCMAFLNSGYIEKLSFAERAL